ncbi:MAG TPA: pyridoxal phosphate-dependent aminotransferase [Candidatus Thermoplasmatota archaeon]|jgi:aspartate/methionine/tyrosine aminotransferase|nr:pyridoxal phosphate-dependent aminotransferase [Candidatus Thermoplasmatota archaeon]
MAAPPPAKPDPFEWAHRTPGIVWMSQNTNSIPTSPRIEEAILRAVQEGKHHLYPMQKGLPGLRDLVRADLGLGQEWEVMLGHGGLECLYAMNRALFAQGDEVVCSDPSFLPIHNQIKLSGAKPVELPIYSPPWKLTPERLGEAITARTKAILLIDPINPLGTAYTLDEVRAIAELAKDKGLVLIHDVTYRDFSDHTSLASEFYPEKTVIVYSFSKNCGLAGMRVGALAAPADLWPKLKEFTVSTLGINVLAQAAAKAALETKKEWMPRVRETSRRNQATIKAAVAKTEGCFLPVYPSHANLFVVDISATRLDPGAVEEHLLFQHKVFVRGGRYVSPRFGDRFVRISFSVPEPDCQRFAEAWPQAIAELRKH